MARLYRIRKKKRKAAEVDITPLIDVMFTLIIFLMVAAAFVQGSIDVSLPRGSPPPLSDTRQIVLTVTRNSEIFWAGKSVSSDDLLLYVAEALLENSDILIAGDRDARYGDVAELMDLLRRSGVPSVGLAFASGR